MPVSSELKGYRAYRGRTDLLAGLTVAALAIPSAMAYAELAGLPTVVGLYALLLPTVAYTFLGSSRQLIIGPEGSISALVAASVLALAAAGSAEAAELAATLAILIAACFLLARVARLGWIADYFSRPVLIGYIHGVVVVLIIGQLGKLLGLDVTAIDPIPQLVEVAGKLGDVSLPTVAVGAIALGILLPLRYLAPRFPAALIVVVAAIAASSVLDLDQHGVAVVGTVPGGLPRLSVPTPPLADVLKLAPAAIGLFFVSFADEILTARAYAGKHDQEVQVRQELLAMAGANAAAGITQGLPVGASGSRTAVNDSMGARSQVAGLLAAGTIVVVLLFLTGPIAHLPKAVLGAAIVSAALGLVDVSAWRDLAATDSVEVAIAAVTAAGVVAVGVLEAMGLAVGLSIIDVVRRSARPHDAVLGWSERLGRWADVSIHRSARVVPGVVVYRLDDRLFFANARYVKGRIAEALRGAPSEPRFLILDAEGLTGVDSAGLALLEELATKTPDGVELCLARTKANVFGELEGAGLVDAIGRDRFFGTVRNAVSACE